MAVNDTDLLILGLLLFAWAFLLALGARIHALFYVLSVIAGSFFAWQIYLTLQGAGTLAIPVTTLWFAIVIFVGIFAILTEVRG